MRSFFSIPFIVYIVFFTLISILVLSLASKFGFLTSLGDFFFKAYNSIYGIFYQSVDDFCSRNDANLIATTVKTILICPALKGFINLVDEEVQSVFHINRESIVREKAIIIRGDINYYDIYTTYALYKFGLFNPNKPVESLRTIVYLNGLTFYDLLNLFSYFPPDAKVLIYGSLSKPTKIYLLYSQPQYIPYYAFIKSFDMVYSFTSNIILQKFLIMVSSCNVYGIESYSFYSCLSNFKTEFENSLPLYYGKEYTYCQNPDSCYNLYIQLNSQKEKLDFYSKLMFLGYYYLEKYGFLEYMAILDLKQYLKKIYLSKPSNPLDVIAGYFTSSILFAAKQIYSVSQTIYNTLTQFFFQNQYKVEGLNLDGFYQFYNNKIKEFLKNRDFGKVMVYLYVLESIYGYYLKCKYSQCDKNSLIKTLEIIKETSNNLGLTINPADIQELINNIENSNDISNYLINYYNKLKNQEDLRELFNLIYLTKNKYFLIMYYYMNNLFKFDIFIAYSQNPDELKNCIISNLANPPSLIYSNPNTNCKYITYYYCDNLDFLGNIITLSNNYNSLYCPGYQDFSSKIFSLGVIGNLAKYLDSYISTSLKVNCQVSFLNQPLILCKDVNNNIFGFTLSFFLNNNKANILIYIT